MGVRLEGKRIILRKPVRADAYPLYLNAKDKEISRYTFLPRPYTLEGAYDFIRKNHIMRRKGRIIPLGIEWRENGQIIGMISLMGIDHKNKNAELGYWLGKKYWGKGIMKEAICLILRYGFRELKLVRIYAHVMHPNMTSASLLERIGFTFEGRRRKVLLHRRKWMDYLCYGMLRGEQYKIAPK
ncbi:MAG: GNAT family protein [candidate division Zixibacteria bacterium]|nr:GNAT family protein [candidate division Zixibacteria bacterium]